MKRYIITTIIVAGLFACTDSPNPAGQDSAKDGKDSAEMAFLDSLNERIDHKIACTIFYDTVTNPKYLAHKIIMERYFVPEKRGWWMNSNGDTLDTYLYPQDIGIFFQELDSTEQGMYRNWTNKIVFMMLNTDAQQMMALPFTVSKDEGAYFLWHVSHPVCNDFGMDSTIARVERNMEGEGKMKAFKEDVLRRLREAR